MVRDRDRVQLLAEVTPLNVVRFRDPAWHV